MSKKSEKMANVHFENRKMMENGLKTMKNNLKNRNSLINFKNLQKKFCSLFSLLNSFFRSIDNVKNNAILRLDYC